MDTASNLQTSGRTPSWIRRIVFLVVVGLAAALVPAVPAGAGPDRPEPVRRLLAEPADESVVLSWRAPVDAADHRILDYRVRVRAAIPAIPADEAGPGAGRVFGGSAIDLAQAPWQVAILSTGVTGINAQFCGGSLIHARWVLTAAHCVSTRGDVTPASDLQVSDGITNLDAVRPNQRIDVVRVIVHPNYETGRGTDVDLALLELRRPARATTIIPLDRAPVIPFGTEGYVSGWGHTNPDRGEGLPAEFPLDLQGGSVQVLAGPGDACGRYAVYDESEHVCAADAGVVDTCAGDSGGPLALLRRGQWVLSGVTSFGLGCGRPNYPGIYARVAPHVRWIHRYVDDLGGFVGRVRGRAVEVSGLTNGMAYEFTVAARTPNGLGAPSTVTATPSR